MLCWSRWSEYSSIETNHSIIRDDHTYRIIHSQRDDKNLGIAIHTFVIHKYSNNTDYYFTTQFDAVDINDYTVSILDMEIFDGVCYFCGAKSYNDLDMGGNQRSEGFVGRFFIDGLFSSYRAIEYCSVKETRSLHALTISEPTNDTVITLVHLVGEMDYWYNYAACIAELQFTSMFSWNATLDYIPSIPDICFSDIQTISNGVILAAQIKCRNNFPYGYSDYDTNHQQFLLDRFSTNGCHEDHPSPGIATMARYVMDYADDYCFHHNKVAMKLCRTPYNTFYLAFGVRENDITKSGLRVFNFSNTPYLMVENLYYKTGGSAHDMLDMVCPTDRDPILLSRGIPYTTGVVTIPRFVDPSQTTVKTYHDQNMILQSLSLPPDNNDFDASGKSLSTDKLMRYIQNRVDWQKNSCFTKETMERTIRPTLDSHYLPVEWTYKYETMPFFWTLSEVSLIKIEETNTCSKCNNN